MLLRIFSALVLIPVTLAVVYFAPPYLYLLVLGSVGSLCLYEYFQIMAGIGWHGQPWFGYIGFWVLLIGFWERHIPAPPLSAGVVMAAFLAAMARRDPIRERVQGLMVNLLGVFYLGTCLYAALAVRYGFGTRAGLEWTLTLFAVVWAGDTAALFAGRRFGRTLFARYLSPKKTNEGAVAGLVAGVFAAVLLRQFLFPDLPFRHVVIVSVLMGIFGHLGDLAESML